MLLCVFAVLLVASGQAQLQQQCMNYFGGLGGEEGISKVGLAVADVAFHFHCP